MGIWRGGERGWLGVSEGRERFSAFSEGKGDGSVLDI